MKKGMKGSRIMMKREEWKRSEVLYGGGMKVKWTRLASGRFIMNRRCKRGDGEGAIEGSVSIW